MPQWCQRSDASMVSQKWFLNGVIMIPLWRQRSDAAMVSQKWCLNGVTMMPQWCQSSDASMVSQKWCLNGVIMIPLWRQISDAAMVSQKWFLNGVIMMPQWRQISDAAMVSQKWCLNGVKEVMPKWCQRSDAFNGVTTLMPWEFMMLWQCHAAVKIEIPTKSRPQRRTLSGWSFHPLGFTWVWPSKILVQTPERTSKVFNGFSNPYHLTSMKHILSHSLGPRLKLPILILIV